MNEQSCWTRNNSSPRNLKLVEMICIEFARGEGTEKDAVRIVEQYWTRDGELIAERDPTRPEGYPPTYKKRDVSDHSGPETPAN